METVLKLTRESSQSVKLAYFCGAYVLAAIFLIPGTFFSVFNQMPVLRFFVFIPPLLLPGLLLAALFNQPRLPFCPSFWASLRREAWEQPASSLCWSFQQRHLRLSSTNIPIGCPFLPIVFWQISITPSISAIHGVMPSQSSPPPSLSHFTFSMRNYGLPRWSARSLSLRSWRTATPVSATYPPLPSPLLFSARS